MKGDEYSIWKRDAWPRYRVKEYGTTLATCWTYKGAQRCIERRMAIVYYRRIEE